MKQDPILRGLFMTCGLLGWMLFGCVVIVVAGWGLAALFRLPADAGVTVANLLAMFGVAIWAGVLEYQRQRRDGKGCDQHGNE